MELNAWCDHYLSPRLFSRFQAAIRKGRQRRKENLARKKQVTLTPAAWNILRTIADKEGLELSEVIETHLKNRYRRYLD
ncbi:MAG: hypothetical protein R3208_14910 [Ketobacteraceae bacterium]|nr:hypothetical protein [Ketobacteraceae bacterium]